jgi:hypothetical protein
VLFFPIPAGSFDFAWFNFQVPICGLAAKQLAAVMSDTAAAITVIRDLFMTRFRQKHISTSMRMPGVRADLLADKDETKSQRVAKAMMDMEKIEMAALKKDWR